MVVSLVLGILGVLEVLFPRRIVDYWFDLATDDGAELRPWVYTAARLEGVIILLWLASRRRDTSTSTSTGA